MLAWMRVTIEPESLRCSVRSPGDVAHAPAPLHTDDCAMVDVIKDVLARVPGPEDQIIVLLQPTQPLQRTEACAGRDCAVGGIEGR
jgi:hypothetical protein